MRTILAWMSLVGLVAVAMPAHAANVDLASEPMGNSIDPSVKPNIMFILDRSGSMSWSHMPDIPLENMTTKIGYKTSQCNGVYYNPAVTYKPPVKADGTSYPNATFTAALNDGYISTSGTVNLNTSFRAYADGSSGSYNTLSASGVSGLDTAQPAYYYQYNGAGGTGGVKQPPMSYLFDSVGNINTTTTFYTQCNAATTTAGAAATSTWTKVVINTSSPVASQQNFANWFSYYRTRMLMMKSAMGLALNQLNDPNSVRIGLVYHDLSVMLPVADYSDTTGVVNATSCASGTTQRAKLYCYLYAATGSGGTPTRTALSKCGQMYSGTGTFIGSGKPDPVQYSCQRNVAMLATDGFWNTDTAGTNFPNIGNADSGGTPPYNDTVAASSNSMADIAAYYYKTDLRTSGALATNNVRTSTKDPANWQHMVTYTLGLGGSGSLGYVDGYETPGNSADYDAIVAGTKNWPNPIPTENVTRMDDLWHAAVNGRGTYYAATSVEKLATGLKNALAEAAENGGGGAAATGNLAPASGDNQAYLASYKTQEWVGDLTQNDIDPKTGVISNTGNWSAQAKLDALMASAPATRKVYWAKSGSLANFTAAQLTTPIANHWFDAGPINPNGAVEQYPFFTSAQQTAATPASMIAFIRGERGLEDADNNTLDTSVTKLYRGRTHVLGDIVNAAPVYVKEPVFDYCTGSDSGYCGTGGFKSAKASRQGVVYVGGNDGMLHAFNANTGDEMWTFIPTAVLPYLYKLADKNYSTKHRAYVDGPITVGDAYWGGAWHTVLIGGLGQGGRAYYALDVTDPNSPVLLWEFSATDSGGVCLGTTLATCDIDLGYTYGGAQITKLNGGKWVAIFSSGYNNVPPNPLPPPSSPPYSVGSGQAYLYVVDIENAGNKVKIPVSGGVATDAATSGIGWINGWTDSGMTNNLVKHVYAGDLSGQVWRFDIVAHTSTLLTTLGKVNGVSVTQPVTTRLELGDWGNDINQRVIYAGTGRYLGFSDVTNTDRQSFYAIRDTGTALKSNIGSPYFRNSGAAKLSSSNRSSANWSYNQVNNNSFGWYLDFDAQDGERVVVHPRISGTDQRNLMVITNIPASDKCAVGGDSYAYFLDSQATKAYTAKYLTDVVNYVGNALSVGATQMTLETGKPIVAITRSDGKTITLDRGTPAYGNTVRHVSWRELKN